MLNVITFKLLLDKNVSSINVSSEAITIVATKLTDNYCYDLASTLAVECENSYNADVSDYYFTRDENVVTIKHNKSRPAKLNIDVVELIDELDAISVIYDNDNQRLLVTLDMSKAAQIKRLTSEIYDRYLDASNIKASINAFSLLVFDL